MKLNIGAGNTVIEGFTPVDVKTGCLAHVLPYADGEVEEIRASHILEHYAFADVAATVAEWFRVLKPGGVMRIAVPDFDKAASAAMRGNDANAQEYLMGGQTDEYDFHKSLFTHASLSELMRNAGLVNIREWHSEIPDCAALPVSLNLQGTKPGLAWPSVVAVASVPRFGPVLHARCCHESLMPLRIPLRQITGAFWGQCLTRGIEEALQGSPDYILTVDFDTIFRPWDVEALIDVMQRNPQIDALCPIQCHRSLKQMLLSVNDEDGKPIVELNENTLRAETMPLVTGHFGLTLFRATAFARLPKPWLIAHPDSEGGWGDGRVDDDIHFWKQWRTSGLSLHLANRVPVGHMMELIAWPGRTLEPTFQNIGEYYEQGTPKQIWI